MKIKTQLIIATFAFAISSSICSAAIPASLPGFKSRAELEKVAKNTQSLLAESDKSEFYTGKPFDTDREEILFMHRSFNPELGRWTSYDPSGFPDGANNTTYVANKVTVCFDAPGLDSQDITEDFAFHLPLIGNVITGSWEGAFVWSFAHGSETARVEQEPGFSGFTGVPTTVVIAGNTVGVGTRSEAHVVDKSAFQTKTVNGVQMKRWIVDLTVKFDVTLTIIVDLKTRKLGAISQHLKGDWYE